MYYSLTPKGRTAQERVVKQIKKSQKEWEEKLLGILAMRKCLDEERFTTCWQNHPDRGYGEGMKRRAFSIVGAIIALLGVIWFLAVS